MKRRDALRLAGLTLGAAGTTALLTACGASPSAGNGRGPNDASEATRGAFRAVFTGGGAGETLDPYATAAPADFVRNDVVYENLFFLGEGETLPGLARDVVVSPGARGFILNLRDDVRWHDGSAFTAADVKYSFEYMSSPERLYPSELQAYFDMAGIEIRSEHSVWVPTLQPLGDPATMLAAFPAKMVKDGSGAFTTETAIGTGPFRVTAFAAGRETVLTRFDEYWGGSAPSQELRILSVTDPQAKVNSIISGQADYTSDIPYTTARAGISAADIELDTAGSRHRTSMGFVLNTTRPPFDDPRVRRAAKLALDRQTLVDTVFLGYGIPGNDLVSAGAPYFSDRDPLPRNLDEARKLVRAAGAANAPVTIRTAEWESGFNASSELACEQWREIGLEARPQIVGLAEFYESEGLAAANGVAFSAPSAPLAVLYGRLNAHDPAMAFDDAEYCDALAAAMAATDDAERQRHWNMVQDRMFTDGNTVIWGLADTLSLARSGVQGLETRGHAKYPYLGEAHHA
ncbi:ABC transporter substrate-binding protein [Hoyosella sp. YIM 151337]|uniref:ABC transporter substrate-binding protein n=1 Tax=Hoyosella sp. YIM 151337 TaxID=2992742 RepID=UPI0022365DF2|nr:ABC transporter substrate-binding protein [Hoyosella sp. YIM 151337]MCW4354050.1 ABC transporter substrate-binding protein [Hoyosella sp. YIM 151337]